MAQKWNDEDLTNEKDGQKETADKDGLKTRLLNYTGIVGCPYVNLFKRMVNWGIKVKEVYGNHNKSWQR